MKLFSKYTLKALDKIDFQDDLKKHWIKWTLKCTLKSTG